MKVVIVGGVAGGASAAARLRRLDEQAEIIILERGEYISYANCGLPYYIGDVITDKEDLTLQTPQSFLRRFNIDVRVLNEAVAVNRAEKTVLVRTADGKEYNESYDKLILSPGAAPIMPPLPGVEDTRLFTLRNIPDTYRIKEYTQTASVKSALVVGGGYIGTEIAENLAEIGVAVTIAEMSDHLIAPLDFDMACDVHHYLRTKGIALRLQTAVKGFVGKPDALYADFDGELLPFDMVVLAVGVKPDTALAAACNLPMTQRGAIKVDEALRTADEHIYAVGDAIEIVNFVTGQPGYIPLAGPANKQGRIVADNITGGRSVFSGTQGSAVVKLFDMTVATTGLNETTAKAAGIEYDKTYTYSASHATYYPGATNMSLKLLFEKKTGRVLGAQIVGFDGVDKRCDVIATAIRAKMTVQDLTELELCYAPPFSSAKDPVNMAGFVGEGVMSGSVKQYFWHDVEEIRQKGTMLDVRTKGEVARGTIAGVVHIPVDDLRGRLGELDKSKPVYVNCQSGLRSYIACRILSQSGFTCYNLAGGYRLYASVTQELAKQQVEFDQNPKHPCGVDIK